MTRLLPLLLALAAALAGCANLAPGSADAAARPEVRYYLIADT
jgi:hypothetical protein